MTGEGAGAYDGAAAPLRAQIPKLRKSIYGKWDRFRGGVGGDPYGFLFSRQYSLRSKYRVVNKGILRCAQNALKTLTLGYITLGYMESATLHVT